MLPKWPPGSESELLKASVSDSKGSGNPFAQAWGCREWETWLASREALSKAHLVLICVDTGTGQEAQDE